MVREVAGFVMTIESDDEQDIDTLANEQGDQKKSKEDRKVTKAKTASNSKAGSANQKNSKSSSTAEAADKTNATETSSSTNAKRVPAGLSSLVVSKKSSQRVAEGDEEDLERQPEQEVSGSDNSSKKTLTRREQRARDLKTQKLDDDAPELSTNVFLDGIDSDEEDSDDEDEHKIAPESWDFTSAIERIKSREDPSQAATTSLDEKIKKALQARALRQAQQELAAEGQHEAAEALGAQAAAAEEAGEDIDLVIDNSKPQKPQASSDEEDEDDEEGEEGEEGDEDFSREMGANSEVLEKVRKRTKQKMELLEKENKKNKIQAASIETFAQLNLSRPLIRATQVLKFDRPTPIQARSIPYAMAGRDICGSAATGSGKTAAFLLPVLERLLFRPKRIKATRVLIVTPTRELTQQVLSMAEALAQFTDITMTAVVGGLSMDAQAMELRARPDIVVATPGRLIDHVLNTKSVDLDDVEILILDEADRLLELGFNDEVMQIVDFCPKNRQTLLFSATMTTSVNELADLSLKRAVRVETDPLYDMASRLVQEFVRVKPQREGDRESMLLGLCTRSFKSKVIIFFRAKVRTHRFGILFGLFGLKAAELHGNLTQRQRLESLQRFRDGEVDFLLCTDVASRGLDIKGVEVVINYEMPNDLSTYVHRVGRTARAGRGGRSVTLTGERQRMLTKEVLRRSQQNVKSRTIPDGVVEALRERIADFEPEIEDVLRQERVERELRGAEAEVERAQRRIQNREEIMSKPKREWFQSQTEKEAIREATRARMIEADANAEDQTPQGRARARKQALLEAEGSKKEDDKDKRPHRMTRAKRRRLAQLEAMDAAAAEEEGEDVQERRPKKRPSDYEGVLRKDDGKVAASARASKRKVREAEAGKFGGLIVDDEAEARKKALREKKREQRAREEGLDPEEYKRPAKPIKQRAKYAVDSFSGFGSELAPGEGLHMLDSRTRKKSKKNNGASDAPIFKEADLSKGGLRKGGKMGSSKFKSKRKFKRR
mmetsp:Transcript_21369/g.41893  ORF Transcript_21369/g.41893 Transcript_21369/m.41893 type:complete len:1005 (-) Transcript_21369:153-3167(-)